MRSEGEVEERWDSAAPRSISSLLVNKNSAGLATGDEVTKEW
jgi:hypothetical protein